MGIRRKQDKKIEDLRLHGDRVSTAANLICGRVDHKILAPDNHHQIPIDRGAMRNCTLEKDGMGTSMKSSPVPR